jgi:cell division protein FtsQ
VTLARGLRSGNLFSKRDAAVLDAPEPSRVSARETTAEAPGRRDYAYANGYPGEYADSFDDEGEFSGRRKAGVRLSFSGGWFPKTRWGRIAAGCGMVVIAGVGIAGLLLVRSFLLRDEHFVVAGPTSIQIAGNSHLTRPQLLSVFGGDVERNIFGIPVAERRAELEHLP